MSSDDALAAVRALTSAVDAIADARLDGLTHPELLSMLSDLETITRRLPAVQHVLLARLQREASPVALGAKSFAQVLTGRLRISGKDARRRLTDAKELGPRVALNGEPLSPVLPLVARAQADGVIGAEHVEIMRGFFDSLPGWVDQRTREQSETDLVRIAVGFTPEVLSSAGQRLSALLDQDGPEPDDTERARKRFISLGRQQADGMTRLTGLLDPQSRATVEAIQAKWAGPGMCNPDDAEPCITGTPPKPRSTETPVATDSARMMRSPRSAATPCPQESWVSTTACRSRSSCPPRCRSWSPGGAPRSPPAGPCSR